MIIGTLKKGGGRSLNGEQLYPGAVYPSTRHEVAEEDEAGSAAREDGRGRDAEPET